MAHYFPDEIIYEILLRLPVKSLVRFTCVDKAWCSMIRSPSFAFAHLAHTNRSHNNHDDRILLLTVFCETKKESNPRHRYISTVVTACLGKQVKEQDQSIKSFDENKELKFSYKSLKHFQVVSSCNGLVLLKLYVDTLVLWNPLLGNIVTIPKPDNIGYEECRRRSTGWGFGFDPRKNDCKVVKIVCLQNNGSVKLDSLVQVFSLSTGYWKSFRVAVPGCSLAYRGLPPFINESIYRLIHRRPQPFVNGAIHWLASSRIGSHNIFHRHLVLSFDISNEIFREIMLPEKLARLSSLDLTLSIYGKSLAVCVTSSAYLYSLWVMKEYGAIESWTQVSNFKTLHMPKPLGFTTSGEILWETDGGEVASYDPKSPKFVNHRVGDEGSHCFAGSYVESLILLNARKRGRKRVNVSLEHTKKRVIKKRRRGEQ